MSDFFNSELWRFISLISTILGIITGAIGFHQWIKSNKELRQYKYLFKIAGQNMDLSDKEQTLKYYDKQIEDLKETIEKQIPIEAERMAIKGILESEILELSNSYSKVIALEAQLAELQKPEKELTHSTDLIKKVEKKIKPQYIENRRNNLFNLLFFLMSVVSSIASMVLPQNLYRLSTVGILLVQVILGLSMIKSYIKLNYTKDEIKLGVRNTIGIISICFGVFSFSCLMFIFADFLELDAYITFVFSIIFYILHFVFFILFFKGEKKTARKILFMILNVLNIITSIVVLFFDFEDLYISIIIISNIIILFVDIFTLIRSLYINNKASVTSTPSKIIKKFRHQKIS